MEGYFTVPVHAHMNMVPEIAELIKYKQTLQL